MISDEAANLDYCYLTTTGRKSRLPREIEIWFGVEGRTVYLLAGGGEKAHWVQNIGTNPAVTLRLGDSVREALGRVVGANSDEDARARRLLLEKYQPRYGGDLAEWGQTALPVALDLEPD